jgi:hypothetical protein
MVRTRSESKERFEQMAKENRLNLLEAFDVLLDSWAKLTPKQQSDVIRRPATA